jgi:methylated-DNA-[protein]-cysteine S-methyltransferase
MTNSISFKTKFGWVNAVEENKEIISISFGKIKNKGSSKILKLLKINIENYFLGKKLNQDFFLKINGSSLQKKIWNALNLIPYGKTKTYGDIAKKVKTSPRYVGRVCGENKHLIITPCHRVIRSDGTLGGFSGLGGIKLKQRLLDLES